MSNKKRKNAILALSIAAVAATTTTVVYFYFRNVLKYMVVKNKVDGSGTLLQFHIQQLILKINEKMMD